MLIANAGNLVMTGLESLRALEYSLTRLPAERAPLYSERAREAGRAAVAEFVVEWLLREQQWRRDP